MECFWDCSTLVNIPCILGKKVCTVWEHSVLYISVRSMCLITLFRFVLQIFCSTDFFSIYSINRWERALNLQIWSWKITYFSIYFIHFYIILIGTLLLGIYIFRILIFSQWSDISVIMKCPFISLEFSYFEICLPWY